MAKECIVAVLMDEVYVQKSIQYSNGKFYRTENDKVVVCNHQKCCWESPSWGKERLLEETKEMFVLLWLIQSDYVEGRFGWFRQLNDGNYYASVLICLQAEKTIQLRSLVEYGYNMAEINCTFSD